VYPFVCLIFQMSEQVWVCGLHRKSISKFNFCVYSLNDKVRIVYEVQS